MLTPDPESREFLDESLLDRLARATKEYPDKVLLTCNGESITRQELWDAAEGLAGTLAELGIGPGDRVGVIGQNSVAHFTTLWATLYLGAVWAPLNPSLGETDLAYTLNDLSASLVLGEAENMAQVLQAGFPRDRLFPMAGGPDEPKGWPERDDTGEIKANPHPWRPGDLAFIMYSGGTTGMPKGIELPAAYPVLAAAKYDEAIDLGDDDIVYSVLQMYHGWLPTVVLIACLYADAKCCTPRRFSASNFLSDIRSYGATVADPFGPMISMILKRTPEAELKRPNSLTRCLAPMGGVDEGSLERRNEFERRFDVTTYEMYGLTETGPLVSKEVPGEQKRGSSGKPGRWYDVAILDEEDRTLPAGAIGEIAVRPKIPHQMAHGYRNQAETTLTTWRNLYVHTGDMGYMDDEGHIWFVGRHANWARRRGENVSVIEVELVIDQHPNVVESAVVGVPSELGDDDIKAYVVVHTETLPHAVAEWCAERLADFKVPRYVEFVDSLPRSATKAEIERFKLREEGVGKAWDRESG